MLIYVKIIKKKEVLYQDGQTHVQLKTIVRNLTKDLVEYFIERIRY